MSVLEETFLNPLHQGIRNQAGLVVAKSESVRKGQMGEMCEYCIVVLYNSIMECVCIMKRSFLYSIKLYLFQK